MSAARRTGAVRLAASMLAAAAVLALTGCAGIEDSLQHQVRASYPSSAALAKAWPTKAVRPDWIPAGATEVRLIAGTAGTSAANSPAAIRVDSTAALPAACRTVQRYSMDPFSESWSPKGAYPASIERCDDWAVIPVHGGYYGWTPLAPEEKRE